MDVLTLYSALNPAGRIVSKGGGAVKCLDAIPEDRSGQEDFHACKIGGGGQSSERYRL